MIQKKQSWVWVFLSLLFSTQSLQAMAQSRQSTLLPGQQATWGTEPVPRYHDMAIHSSEGLRDHPGSNRVASLVLWVQHCSSPLCSWSNPPEVCKYPRVLGYNWEQWAVVVERVSYVMVLTMMQQQVSVQPVEPHAPCWEQHSLSIESIHPQSKSCPLSLPSPNWRPRKNKCERKKSKY